jgi:hypothetical protein
MNGLSVNELCCLFCCPPCPSQIVAKLAFLPPSPTYKLIINGDQTVYPSQQQLTALNNDTNLNSQSTPPLTEQTALQQQQLTDLVKSETLPENRNNLNIRSNNRNSGGIGNFFHRLRMSSRSLCAGIVCAQRYGVQQATGQQSKKEKGQQLYQQLHTNAKIIMMDKAEWQYGPVELEKLEIFLAKTERGHQIACLFVRCTPNPKYTILFSHGNAVDLGQMSSFYYGLGSRLDCNIFTYDYSGYGASGSSPTEKNLYADIQAAWNALIIRYGKLVFLFNNSF